jgi:hypothetical protein
VKLKRTGLLSVSSLSTTLFKVSIGVWGLVLS